MITSVNNQPTQPYSTQHHSMSARAPAKIILSGEHSVVYGADAIAVAIQKYTHVSFVPHTACKKTDDSNVIYTQFVNLPDDINYSIDTLDSLKSTLDDRFQHYLEDRLAVQDILDRPHDLAMYTICTLMQQQVQQSSLRPQAGILSSHSHIPMGAGMGSSAAAITAILVLYENLFNISLSRQQRCELVRFCERLQHGKGSAIDASTITFGGINYLSGDTHKKIELAPLHLASLDNTPLDHQQSHWYDDWYWLDTGSPDSTTGECVSVVGQHHADDQPLWSAFNTVTNALLTGLQDPKTIAHCFKENQHLLTTIGVVSTTAQQVINFIEKYGGTAKISGAGTITGEKNGLMLAYLPKGSLACHAVEQLINLINVKFYGYIKDWGKILVDNQGARILNECEY